MVLEKPVKSLSRWYTADLNDCGQVEQLGQDTINGLRQINSIVLPGKLKHHSFRKLKLWCFQVGSATLGNVNIDHCSTCQLAGE